MTATREPQSHVRADGVAKRSFETENAAAIEAQRLDRNTNWRWTWYECSQRPSHWHVARLGGAR